MKPWLWPSGRQRGIAFILPDDWSAEQALAVVELLDDLREQIWRHYQIPLHELLEEQRGPVWEDTTDSANDLPPF